MANIDYVGEILGDGSQEYDNLAYSVERKFVFTSINAKSMDILQRREVPTIKQQHPDHSFLTCRNRFTTHETDAKGDKWVAHCIYTGRNLDDDDVLKPWDMPAYAISTFTVDYERVFENGWTLSEIIDPRHTGDYTYIKVLNTAGDRYYNPPTKIVRNFGFKFTYNVKDIDYYQIMQYIDTLNMKKQTILGIELAVMDGKILNLDPDYIQIYDEDGLPNPDESYWAITVELEIVNLVKHSIKLDSYGFNFKDGSKKWPIYTIDGKYGDIDILEAESATGTRTPQKITEPVPLDENGDIAINETTWEFGEAAQTEFYPWAAWDWSTLSLPNQHPKDFRVS